MPDPRDIVDIAGLRSPDPRPSGGEDATRAPNRAFLMIWFRCCETYGRLPKAPDATCYEGRCPKCLAHLRVPIGQGGTSRRIFEAG